MESLKNKIQQAHEDNKACEIQFQIKRLEKMKKSIQTLWGITELFDGNEVLETIIYIELEIKRLKENKENV